MKIQTNNGNRTVQFIAETVADLFPLGKLAERLKGHSYSTGEDGREVEVSQDELIKFLTK